MAKKSQEHKAQIGEHGSNFWKTFREEARPLLCPLLRLPAAAAAAVPPPARLLVWSLLLSALSRFPVFPLPPGCHMRCPNAFRPIQQLSGSL